MGGGPRGGIGAMARDQAVQHDPFIGQMIGPYGCAQGGKVGHGRLPSDDPTLIAQNQKAGFLDCAISRAYRRIIGKFSGKNMPQGPVDHPLDPFDRKILSELSRDGRLPITDLSARVGLSKSPTQVRLRRLEAQGYILGYRAVLNPERLDRELVAFVEVRLTDTREPALKAFNAAVRLAPEIEQAHLIAGQFDYLLKIRCQNMRAYRQILADVVSNLPHVASTSTHVSMQGVKDRAF